MATRKVKKTEDHSKVKALNPRDADQNTSVTNLCSPISQCLKIVILRLPAA